MACGPNRDHAPTHTAGRDLLELLAACIPVLPRCPPFATTNSSSSSSSSTVDTTRWLLQPLQSWTLAHLP